MSKKTSQANLRITAKTPIHAKHTASHSYWILSTYPSDAWKPERVWGNGTAFEYRGLEFAFTDRPDGFRVSGVNSGSFGFPMIAADQSIQPMISSLLPPPRVAELFQELLQFIYKLYIITRKWKCLYRQVQLKKGRAEFPAEVGNPNFIQRLINYI